MLAAVHRDLDKKKPRAAAQLRCLGVWVVCLRVFVFCLCFSASVCVCVPVRVQYVSVLRSADWMLLSLFVFVCLCCCISLCLLGLTVCRDQLIGCYGVCLSLTLCVCVAVSSAASPCVYWVWPCVEISWSDVMEFALSVSPLPAALSADR